MATLKFPVIFFRVSYDPGSTLLDEDEAMLQIFAFSDPIRMKANSKTLYIAGNYDRYERADADSLSDLLSSAWVGSITVGRELQAVRVTRDPDRGNRIQTVESAGANADEGTIFLSYFPDARVLALTEKSVFPYTRISTFARRAATQYAQKGGYKRPFQLNFEPWRATHSLWEHVATFDELRKLSIHFRHSQSPGVRLVDAWFDDIRADKMSQSIEADRNGALDVGALRDEERHPIHQAVEHVDRNSDNGYAVMHGAMHGEEVKLDSRDPVVRHRGEAESDKMSDLARMFFQMTARERAQLLAGPDDVDLT